MAQPELTRELVDFLRPMVSSGQLSTTGAKRSKENNINDDESGSVLAALSDSPTPCTLLDTHACS